MRFLKFLKNIQIQSMEIISNKEIERKNDHIRKVKYLSGYNIVIVALSRIIDAQKLNASTDRKDFIRISSYNLGIENDYDDIAKITYHFQLFVQKGFFSSFEYDGVAFKIFNVDVKNIRNFINQFNESDDAHGSQVSDSDISIVSDGDGVNLTFKHYGKLRLSGKRAKILNFFYSSVDRKSWKSYEKIKAAISDLGESSEIRKAIEKINSRFNDYSGGSYGDIIERQYLSPHSEYSYSYRWKF